MKAKPKASKKKKPARSKSGPSKPKAKPKVIKGVSHNEAPLAVVPISPTVEVLTKENIETKKPFGRPSEYDPRYCQDLIEHMQQGGSIETFGGKLGKLYGMQNARPTSTIYVWFDAHPDFLEAKKTGESLAQLWYEERANDAIAGNTLSFNATAYVFNMKNKFGWRDKREITGPEGGPVKFQNLTDEELEKEIAEQDRRLRILEGEDLADEDDEPSEDDDAKEVE